MSEVTVVMPNYNNGKLIAESIKSVLGQTYSDFELLVVDDGSTDESITIARDFANRDTRVKVLSNDTNRGSSYSRNCGIRAATGEYICFIDSDDIFRPTRLEKMIASLRWANDSVGYTDLFLLDDDGNTIRETFMGTKGLPPNGYAYSHFLTDVEWGTSTFMAHASTIRQTGYFDESLSWGEDLEYVLRLTERHKVVLVPEALYGYRMHDRSMTSLYSLKFKGQAYVQILEHSLDRNWNNLDELARFKAIQRIRRSAKESRLSTKYLYWSLSPRFIRVGLRYLPTYFAYRRSKHTKLTGKSS
jgi:glycosyltransferase involved in cell wall biosynthesis